MSEYLNTPLIALGALAAATGVAAIVTTLVSNRRKERQALAQRRRQRQQRDAEGYARIFAERRRAKRQPSVPAPGRAGFRTDRVPGGDS